VAGSVKQGAKLGVLALAMINIAAVVTPKNLPITAEYGMSMFFYVGIATLVFLIPIGLAAAELASLMPPKAGGVYVWVREAFGERLGFLAVWCEWSENLTWFPTVLAYVAGALAYVIEPSLAANKFFLVAVMLSVLWGTTAANFLTTSSSTRLTSIGTMLGAILPVVLMVGLAIAWLADGRGSQLDAGFGELLPDLNVAHMVLLAGIILGFAGMELAGYHAREAADPERDYPRAMALSAAVVVAFVLLGSLALAIVVPQHEISLVDGAMQFFQTMLDGLGIGWLLKPVAALVVIGAMAHLSPWILGPAKGLAAVARRGKLPPVLGRLNGNGVPAAGMVVQGIGGSLFALLFLFIPGVNTSYWILTALTTQVFVVMYVLIFASVIRLRYTQPDRERAFRVPGGKPGVWLIMGFAIAGSLFAFVLGFFPPSQLDSFSASERVWYYVGMAGGFIALTCPPFLIQLFRRQGWAPMPEPEQAG